MRLSRRKFMLGASSLVLTATLPIKTLDASFGPSSMSANTWYHVFLLPNGDMGFDTDPGGKNLGLEPARVGSIRTDSGGNIIPFEQHGDTFSWRRKKVAKNKPPNLSRTKKELHKGLTVRGEFGINCNLPQLDLNSGGGVESRHVMARGSVVHSNARHMDQSRSSARPARYFSSLPIGSEPIEASGAEPA